MKKNIVSLIVSISLFLILLSPTKAVSLTPNSGNLTAESTVTLDIQATPEAGEVGLELQLQIAGATVENFVPASGFTVSSGTCVGSVSFTDNTVCHVYASSTPFTDRQSLGILTLKTTSSSSVIILSSGTEYATETDTREFSEQIASYSVTTATQLPATAFGGNLKQQIFLLSGLLSLLVAFIIITKNIIKLKN